MVGFEGEHAKNVALKEREGEKLVGVKRRSPKRIIQLFAVTVYF